MPVSRGSKQWPSRQVRRRSSCAAVTRATAPALAPAARARGGAARDLPLLAPGQDRHAGPVALDKSLQRAALGGSRVIGPIHVVKAALTTALTACYRPVGERVRQGSTMPDLSEPLALRFDNYLLDRSAGVLLCLHPDGKPSRVPLGGRAFRILCLLAERRGAVVTRQEIMD